MTAPTDDVPELPVERPPAGRYFAYRVLDVRVPPQHQGWVRADIAGDWFPLRWIAGRYALMVGTMLVVVSLIMLVEGAPPQASWLLPVLIGASVGLLVVPFTWHAVRRRAWRRHVEFR